MNETRFYIIERADLEFQLKQYISATKAILIKLLRDVHEGKLDSESKKVLEDRFVKLIKGKHDYTKSGEQKKLFTALKLPASVNESHLEEIISFVSEPAQFADTTKGFFNKIAKRLGDFFDTEVNPKILKKVGIGMAAAAIFLAFSFSVISLYKKHARNKQFRNIVDTDINPIVLGLVRAIIRERLTSITGIDSAMEEVSQGVIRKHLLKRD